MVLRLFQQCHSISISQNSIKEAKTMDELKIIEQISLDFSRNNIKVVNVKQLDTKSRYINILCTNHGEKVYLDQGTMSAVVRCKKPDGLYVLNDCEVLEDGTILFELTQQMLAVPGKCQLDIMILDSSKMEELTTDTDSDGVDTSNVPALSTMYLYLNVIATAIEHSGIDSDFEYDKLTKYISTIAKMEAQATEAANICVNASTILEDCKTAIINASDAAEKCANASSILERCENAARIIENEEVVLKTNIANNLTTTSEGSVLDATQGMILNNYITALTQRIEFLESIIQYDAENDRIVINVPQSNA